MNVSRRACSRITSGGPGCGILSHAALVRVCVVLFASLASLAVVPGAFALLRFNDGKDQVFVTFNAGAGYDSNIYTYNGGPGDFIYSAGVVINYTRRAGLIGVDASAGLNLSDFVTHSDENSVDPVFSLELSKSTGRTTGSLTLNAAHHNDPDVNTSIRAESWDYGANFAFRYPVIERYSVTGAIGYARTDYLHNDGGLVDLDTFTASTDLFYVLNSRRDIFVGYRYRDSTTSDTGGSQDHAITTGLSGQILPKLNGTIRVGYQRRHYTDSGIDETYDGLTAAISTTWTVSKRLNVTGTLTHDFQTTSTGSTTETTILSIESQYAVNSRLSLNSNLGTGLNQYKEGNRRDWYYTAGIGFGYTLHPRLQITGSYQYYQNYSNLSLSEFSRHTFNLGASSRW
ncbi:surface lipoprotein assembly modifier [Geminisphaera colitermitum]|uniref:surface lipoprotein assembly modifier n=1 Tax=Geminisphaera colitermitum TaxID=1148786 RepID=UPI0001964F09|nr:outer membrane beta-barrel protein [Geminisphaera colitermitum]